MGRGAAQEVGLTLWSVLHIGLWWNAIVACSGGPNTSVSNQTWLPREISKLNMMHVIWIYLEFQNFGFSRLQDFRISGFRDLKISFIRNSGFRNLSNLGCWAFEISRFQALGIRDFHISGFSFLDSMILELRTCTVFAFRYRSFRISKLLDFRIIGFQVRHFKVSGFHD